LPTASTARCAERFVLAPRWRPFAEARSYVHRLGLHSSREWRAFARGTLPGAGPRPADIPASPGVVYRYHGWAGHGDWLGCSARCRYRPFRYARRFVRSLGLESVREWKLYAAGRMPDRGVRPGDIPAQPCRIYAGRGWVSWSDWLGNGIVTRGGRAFAPFVDARTFARSLGLCSASEWDVYTRGQGAAGDLLAPLPDDMPAFPHVVYAQHGWIGWQDWLALPLPGGGRPSWRSFEVARAFVRRLALVSNAEWRRYVRGQVLRKPPKPDDVPSCPDVVYRGAGWVSWGDWLGTGTVASARSQFRPYAEARRFVHGLKLRTSSEWRLYTRGRLPGRPPCPEDIPSVPEDSYRAEWTGWADFLGRGSLYPLPSRYRSFQEARDHVRGLGLSSVAEWRRHCSAGKLPRGIPRRPDYVYRRTGWQSWGDWLGTGRVGSRSRAGRARAGS